MEKLDVSATEAFTKFKDKNLDGKKADFSDRLRRGRNVSVLVSVSMCFTKIIAATTKYTIHISSSSVTKDYASFVMFVSRK